MPKIIAALLARNEAGSDRYLERSVRAALDLCDSVVVLDDASTDQTRALAASVDPERVIVHSRGGSGGWWGVAESSARSDLWNLAAEEAGPDGWILVVDADMVLREVSSADLHALCESTAFNCWAMPLWDCWDEPGLMRVDGYWQAHLNPRVWLAKAQPFKGFQPEWDTKGIHAGHLPVSYPICAGVMPGLTAWQHLAYVRAEHREAKIRQYLDISSEKTKLVATKPEDRND